jgi:hypothetical protein
VDRADVAGTVADPRRCQHGEAVTGVGTRRVLAERQRRATSHESALQMTPSLPEPQLVIAVLPAMS